MLDKFGILGLIFSAICFLHTNNIAARRNQVLQRFSSALDRDFKDYRSAACSSLGRRENLLWDAVAESSITRNLPVDILETKTGNTLVYDCYLERYFRSDAEKIRQAVNTANRRIEAGRFVTVNEFFDEIRLPHEPYGEYVGWDEPFELHFSSHSIGRNNDISCLAIQYWPSIRT